MEPTQKPTASGQVLALAGAVLTIALSVGVAALEKADVLAFSSVLQVSGFVSPMIASALGGVLYAKR